MPRAPRSYILSPALVVASIGAGAMCLSEIGRTFRLYSFRPDQHFNSRAVRAADGVRWVRVDDPLHPRADLPSGAAHVIAPVMPSPALIRVDIYGPLEQRAGFHDPCSGWSDGHDAVAERLCAAFVEGDVLLVVDSPGGAAAGLQQGVAKALAAKEKYGRRCTGFANEMIGSAATWWTMAICDEVFGPVAAQFGSIGARGAHTSIAGMLAKDGVVVTYFADPPDKVAFAPEFPLGPVGEARGNRDVKIAADAFRAAVCASPLGLRSGLTPEGLTALGADMLTGQAAVDAGLADGVASEEEVTAYALKMAERTATSSSAQARARGDTTMANVRTEDEDEKARAKARAEDGGGPPSSEKPGDGEPPESDRGTEIPTACAACGVENEQDAKFCKGCGESMATKPLEETTEAAPPSSKPKPGQHPPPPERMAATADFAEIFGLAPGASLPAQKAAALDLRQVSDHVSKLTGHRTAPGMLSGLNAIAYDASQAARLRAERDTAHAKQAAVERRDLCKRLVASGGESRGRVFVDDVDASGKRTGVKLAPMFAEMRIGTLRDLVTDHEAKARPRNPFEPDRAEAEARAKEGQRTGGADKATRIERAKKDPTVLRMFHAPGNTHSLDAIAAQHIQTIDTVGGAP